MSSGYTLSMVGCGTMGVAILSGVLDSQKAQSGSSSPNGGLSSSQILSSSDSSQDLTQLPSRYYACVSRAESGLRLKQTFPPSEHPNMTILVQNNLEAFQKGDVIVLGCKPQMVRDILAEKGVKEALKGKLLVSICAGLTIETMKQWVDPSTKVVRAMPNTPSKVRSQASKRGRKLDQCYSFIHSFPFLPPQIREGMTILSPLPSDAPPIDSSIVLSLFSSVGRCRFLPEKHFDACTALAGSGPAFACVFLEAMADGAVMMGLPRREALELAAQTMQGAARMVLNSGMHPAAIKDSVTSECQGIHRQKDVNDHRAADCIPLDYCAAPGGCTIAGLLNLEDGKVRSTVARTIQGEHIRKQQRIAVSSPTEPLSVSQPLLSTPLDWEVLPVALVVTRNNIQSIVIARNCTLRRSSDRRRGRIIQSTEPLFPIRWLQPVQLIVLCSTLISLDHVECVDIPRVLRIVALALMQNTAVNQHKCTSRTLFNGSIFF